MQGSSNSHGVGGYPRFQFVLQVPRGLENTHVLFVCTYVIASSVGCALDLLSSLMYNCEHTQHGIYFCCCLQSFICLGFGLGFSV